MKKFKTQKSEGKFIVSAGGGDNAILMIIFKRTKQLILPIKGNTDRKNGMGKCGKVLCFARQFTCLQAWQDNGYFEEIFNQRPTHPTFHLTISCFQTVKGV